MWSFRKWGEPETGNDPISLLSQRYSKLLILSLWNCQSEYYTDTYWSLQFVAGFFCLSQKSAITLRLQHFEFCRLCRLCILHLQRLLNKLFLVPNLFQSNFLFWLLLSMTVLLSSALLVVHVRDSLWDWPASPVSFSPSLLSLKLLRLFSQVKMVKIMPCIVQNVNRNFSKIHTCHPSFYSCFKYDTSSLFASFVLIEKNNNGSKESLSIIMMKKHWSTCY